MTACTDLPCRDDRPPCVLTFGLLAAPALAPLALGEPSKASDQATRAPPEGEHKHQSRIKVPKTRLRFPLIGTVDRKLARVNPSVDQAHLCPSKVARSSGS